MGLWKYKWSPGSQIGFIISQFPRAEGLAQFRCVLCSESPVAKIKVVVRLHSPVEFRVLFQVHVDVGGSESHTGCRGGGHTSL